MATINILGNALSGVVGSGTFAAQGSSVGAGQIATWSPTLIFASNGDLSVSYATQQGYYHRCGNIYVVSFNLVCTPTYTTATGQAFIITLPNTNRSATGNTPRGNLTIGSAFTWQVGITQYVTTIASNDFKVQLIGIGSGKALTSIGVTQFTSGTQISLQSTIQFMI
jgi:hypothetical protein